MTCEIPEIKGKYTSKFRQSRGKFEKKQLLKLL